jgi:membrane protein YdbS with pleckstrin-like domain
MRSATMARRTEERKVIMALVTCPECRQQISTDAVSCPHCGKILSGGAVASSAAPAGSGVVFAPAGAPVEEQTLWEGGPSVALIYGKVLRLVIRGIVLFAIGYFVITTGLPAATSIPAIQSLVGESADTIQWAIVAILVLALVPPLIQLFTAVARIKSTHYKVTNQRILLERGVFSKSLEEIDTRSVDDTEFHQTLLERLFGIGEVWIVSTDKVAPKEVLHGIRDPRKTRELIRTVAYQASQRQLYTRST